MSFRVVLAWLSNPQTDLPRWDIKNSALELQSGIATKEEAVRVLEQHRTRSFLGEPGYTYRHVWQRYADRVCEAMIDEDEPRNDVTHLHYGDFPCLMIQESGRETPVAY